MSAIHCESDRIRSLLLGYHNLSRELIANWFLQLRNIAVSLFVFSLFISAIDLESAGWNLVFAFIILGFCMFCWFYESMSIVSETFNNPYLKRSVKKHAITSFGIKELGWPDLILAYGRKTYILLIVMFLGSPPIVIFIVGIVSIVKEKINFYKLIKLIGHLQSIV